MRNIFIAIATFLIFSSCSTKNKLPKLVLFIEVDQLSEDMFATYHDLFQDAYKWLLDNGVWYTNMNHEHWYATTGPGHFVLGSGLYPKTGGLLGNYYYHRKLNKTVYCIDDTLAHEIGNNNNSYSYRQISGTTIGDWLKNKYPKAKVYSVSGKDRSAVLLGGKTPDLALWYNWNGKFVSSDYYAKEYPEWLLNYNKTANLIKYRDSLWTRELDENI